MPERTGESLEPVLQVQSGLMNPALAESTSETESLCLHKRNSTLNPKFSPPSMMDIEVPPAGKPGEVLLGGGIQARRGHSAAHFRSWGGAIGGFVRARAGWNFSKSQEGLPL